MSYIKYFPVPSDRMGALWTLESIKDVCIIEFGPAGTTHFAIEGLMNLNGDSHAQVLTTHISEHDLTFGDTTRLEKAIRELDEKKQPKYIFVFSSSLASIIGIDIASVCFELENQVRAKLIPVDTGGFSGDFTLGVKNTLTLMAKEMVKEPKKKHLVYNIIGGHIDEFNHASDIKEMKRMMHHHFNMSCQAIFGHGGCVDDIEMASESMLNIVMRSEGVQAAVHLEKKYGIPYVECRPYGFEGSMAFISKIEEVLSVKPQFVEDIHILQSYVRQLKRHDGDCKITLSGNFDAVRGMIDFFDEMDFKCVQGIVNHKKPVKTLKPHDERIHFTTSEQEKMLLLNTFDPDIILGDGVMKVFAEEHHKIYYQVANPNLELIKIFDGTPFIGVQGGLYICEILLNVMKLYAYQK